MSQEFSFILTTSKRSPVKVERDRGKEWYNSIQNLLKTKNIHHFPRFTDIGPSIVERVIRTIRNLLGKLMFSAGNADCLSELSAVVKHYNISLHHSIEMTPFQASKKSNEKKVFSNLKDNREVRKPKFKLGQLVRTADIKRVFSKRDGTYYSYKLSTTTEVIHDTITSYRINYLPERYNENLLLPTKLTLEQNNQVMKELNLIQYFNK